MRVDLMEGREATLVGRARVLAVLRARPAALHRRTYTGRRGGLWLNSKQALDIKNYVLNSNSRHYRVVYMALKG